MADELRLPRALAEEMVEHCVEGRPNEACGIVGASDGEIVKIFRMTNIEGSPVRYRFDSKEQLAVYRTLDDNGWDLGGVFHSHTRTDAYPSPTDVREAREEVPYIIVSLAVEPADIKAYRILKASWDADEGEIVDVPITLIG